MGYLFSSRNDEHAYSGMLGPSETKQGIRISDFRNLIQGFCFIHSWKSMRELKVSKVSGK